jgi:two-component system chemotaxis response regulator CheY
MSNFNANILLAEDIPSYREYLRELLREFGYTNVLEASNGREALGILASNETDLVITDYCMAPLSGLDVLRTAREHLRMHDLPFMMITGVGDELTISRAERYGVGIYLEKPLHVDLFRDSVAAALEGSLPRALPDKYRHLRGVAKAMA